MKKRLPIIILALIIIVIAAVAVQRMRQDAGDTIRLSGNIEITAVEASFRIPGRVVQRLVDEGNEVRAGQVIARLDAGTLEQEVALRQAESRAAGAQLAELEAGSRVEEIGQGEAALARAEAEATRAGADLKRVRNLFEREVVSRRDLDNATAADDAARASARQAREALTLTRKGPRRERIDQGRARLHQADAAQAIARTTLSYAVLTAPISGTVMAKHVEPGELVAAGTPVVTIGDVTHTWVRCYLGETDLGRVKLGQQATVRIDSRPGEQFAGTVSFIAAEAEFTPKSVQTPSERVKLVYRIKIDIPNPDGVLKPGMPADAEIAAPPRDH